MFAAQSIVADSDGGRIWHFAKVMLEDGTGPAFRSLEMPLPVALYAYLLGMFGYGFPLPLLQALFSVLIVIVVFKLAVKHFSATAAALSIMLFLLSYEFFSRSTSIKPYPLFVFFIMTTLYFLDRSLETETSTDLAFAALTLALAVYTFSFSIVAIPVPGLFLLLNRSDDLRSNLRKTAVFYAWLAGFIAPWFLWRMTVAGKYFYQSPYTWLWLKYRQTLNLEFWHRPDVRSLVYYRRFLRQFDLVMFMSIVTAFFLPGLLLLGRDLRLLISLLAGFLLAPIILGLLPPETRYLYPLLPLLVIGSGVGLEVILLALRPRSRSIILAMFTILALAMVPQHLDNQAAVSRKRQNSAQEIAAIRSFLKPGERIFTRSYQNQAQLPENLIVTKTDMTEAEAIVFYSWIDDRQVRKLMRTHNISWILLHNSEYWENRYNVWLRTATGFEPKHYYRINKSSYFKKIYKGKSYILYKVE